MKDLNMSPNMYYPKYFFLKKNPFKVEAVMSFNIYVNKRDA